MTAASAATDGMARPGRSWRPPSVRIATRLAVLFGSAAILLIYAPMIWLGVMSVSERPLSGLPYPLSGQWYDDLFRDVDKWLPPLELSIVIGLIVALCCMVAATMVGRALPRLKRRGGVILLFLLPLFVPGIVVGGALFMYYKALIGIKMGLWSLVLGHFIWSFPFALLAMLVVTARFDERLLEAAEDLGASPWHRFWHIEVPLLKPGIVAAGFFGFLLSFNELPRSIFLRSGEVTLPVHLWAESASHVSSVPLIYAMSTIITIASVVLTVVALRMLFFSKRAGAGF